MRNTANGIAEGNHGVAFCQNELQYTRVRPSTSDPRASFTSGIQSPGGLCEQRCVTLGNRQAISHGNGVFRRLDQNR